MKTFGCFIVRLLQDGQTYAAKLGLGQFTRRLIDFGFGIDNYLHSLISHGGIDRKSSLGAC